MTVLYKTTSLWVCSRLLRPGTDVESDGKEGPDDGTGHVHPEIPFHDDIRGFRAPHP